MELAAVGAGTDGRVDGLVGELRGVPKPTLRAVFGKALGGKIWEQGRRAAADTSSVRDGEIVAGMIDYVSRQAGETLRQRGRQAKAIGLRVTYGDGVSTLERMRLARPTNQERELTAAAAELYARSERRPAAIEEVNLTATSVQTECVSEHAHTLDYALAGART